MIRASRLLVTFACLMLCLPCEAQYSYGGFRSYANSSARYQSSGIGGYNTSRSTQAAQQLAGQVSTIFSQVMSNAAQQSGGMLPPMSKQEMLRVFMEGGSPQSSPMQMPASNPNSSAATSTAYSNYQTAENEATKARNAAQRTRGYDRSQWTRKDDASRAEYAANNANYAAQRAESAAYNGDSQARSYANLARAAANRARDDANRARYNADTMS